MSTPKSPRTTSAAKSVAPARETFRNAPGLGDAFAKDRAAPAPPKRASSMVKQDRPKPAPRPSPGLAHGVDAAAFNARWEAERAAADKAKRRAAFFTERKKQAQARRITRSRND